MSVVGSEQENNVVRVSNAAMRNLTKEIEKKKKKSSSLVGKGEKKEDFSLAGKEIQLISNGPQVENRVFVFVGKKRFSLFFTLSRGFD